MKLTTYEKECLGILPREECFPMYFDCEDYDCIFYEECREEARKK